MSRGSSTSIRGVLAIIAVLLLAACGTSPPTTAETDTSAAEPTEEASSSETAEGDDATTSESAFETVLAELEGLEGEERTERLAELARAEDAPLDIYTSNADLVLFAEQFAEKYELPEPSVYRALANQVVQRLVEEDQAGFTGADFVELNGQRMVVLNQEGLLHPYDGPALEGLVDAALQEGWTGSRINIYVVAWNTNLVEEPPTSYEDLADSRFAGQLMVEERAVGWYLALSEYWTGQGMSQEEVDELLSGIISNASRVRGHTVQTQFLVAGEYGMTANVYQHLVDQQTVEGAPTTWKPVVEPVVLQPSGVGLIRTAQHPASALLFYEWLLSSEAQERLLEEQRLPVLVEAQGGALDGVETISVDLETLQTEGDEWEQRYEDLLNNAVGTAEG